MRKEFEFNVKDHKIKVTNSWLHGAKLYVDGDFRDFDKSLSANGKNTVGHFHSVQNLANYIFRLSRR
ncbi:hypothetical protein [Paraglaciecola sp. MB-3u-78]|uniref:hypothetical protein n=1 Tax=Paraglaciecola sp. MB-3u-78 TaxID=2058332 RepID=UPI000C34C829|nr:hypothetical protein [Paraglaciecola sp. MB-3u-78]PKH00671.1 hypothetical protein CXF95_00080 [Paraglaciecola sp. MB-3u-78]